VTGAVAHPEQPAYARAMEPDQRTEVLPIQLAVASASPTGWRDGIVMAALDGAVTIALLDGSLIGLDVAVEVGLGSPVAFHRAAELLSSDGLLSPARLSR